MLHEGSTESGSSVPSAIDRFRIVKEIGRGAVGVVYRALDPRLEREVALKLFSPGSAGDPLRIARFKKEGVALAALKHPNIVQIHDAAEWNGRLYIVMQLVEGVRLSDHLTKSRDGMSLQQFFELAVPIVGAVAQAHRQGIIHRDLKPANILIGTDGRPMVVDFGLVKYDQRPGGDQLTIDGSVVGTPGYMSPEQAGGLPADARSDVFSLGVMLFEMLAGRHPSPSWTSIGGGLFSTQTISDVPLPAAVRPIIQVCLKRKATDRYADASALLAALDEVANLPEGARVAPPGGPSVPTPDEVLPHRHDLLVLRLKDSIAKLNRSVSHSCGKKYDDHGTQRDDTEPQRSLISAFETDKERIALSKPFRRLKHKTRFFWPPASSLFRTRLTHTIQIAQIGRQLGRLLGLNCDLIDAIAYGYHVGYPPLGERSKDTLQEWIREYLAMERARDNELQLFEMEHPPPFVFDPHRWAWKILQTQEALPQIGQRPAMRGLNLTQLVQRGIERPALDNTSSVEAQTVAVASELTWLGADYSFFQFMGPELPPEVVGALRSWGSTPAAALARAISEVVVASVDRDQVLLPEPLRFAIQQVRDACLFIHQNHEPWQRREHGSRQVIRDLMSFYMAASAGDIDKMLRRITGTPPGTAVAENDFFLIRRWTQEGVPKLEAVIDHIACMSDGFALDVHRYVYAPEALDYYF